MEVMESEVKLKENFHGKDFPKYLMDVNENNYKKNNHYMDEKPFSNQNNNMGTSIFEKEIENAKENENENECNDSQILMTKAVETPTQGNVKGNFIGCCEKGKNIKNNEIIDSEEGEEKEHHHLLTIKDNCNSLPDETFQGDFDDSMQPLTERWSPLGANYDDTMTPSSELLSPESEMELLSSDSQEKEISPQSLAELARLRTMEEEQEMLTQSLMALTSHFAHVQLRVRQIVEAPSNERDQLLKDLEEFAFQGIPEPPSDDITSSPKRSSSSLSLKSTDLTQQQRQFELIDHLKSQLSELEKMAYESGAPVLPQHMLLEKQRVIIDELKQKLNLKVEEYQLPALSSEELKNQVDSAIGEIVGPLKMKDQLVAQLKTQITDLERFIAYLQCETVDGTKTLPSSDKVTHAYNSYAAKKKAIENHANESLKNPPKDVKKPIETKRNDNIAATSSVPARQNDSDPENQGVRESLNSKAHGLLDKASLLMQMFATTHFGTKPEHFQKNILKKTNKGNHWGDLRAQLEVDIQEVASLAATLNFDREKLNNMRRIMKKSSNSKSKSVTTLSKVVPNGVIDTVPRASKESNTFKMKTFNMSSDDSDDEDNDIYDTYNWKQTSRRMMMKGDSINILSKELTAAVRKNFAMTLLRLIQHGLRIENESSSTSLMVPFMRCLHPSVSALPNQRPRDNTFLPSSSYRKGYCDEDYEDEQSGFFGSGDATRPMHPWELILEYYYLKNGDEYNNTPARKLSESFKLDIIDSQAVTTKQSLLSTIGMIIGMHRPYKRSLNAHFKAFICAALNEKQLVEWLNLIFSCNELIEAYYLPNSYVVRTGFRDSLRSIDLLTKYDFDLPIDLAVRHFRNL